MTKNQIKYYDHLLEVDTTWASKYKSYHTVIMEIEDRISAIRSAICEEFYPLDMTITESQKILYLQQTQLYFESFIKNVEIMVDQKKKGSEFETFFDYQ